MNYTKQQVIDLFEEYGEDPEPIESLLDFMNNDWKDFEEYFDTLFDIIDAMELEDDSAAIDWVSDLK